MRKPRLFLCSGADQPADPGLLDDCQVIKLDSLGAKPNVHIRIENVTKVFAKDLSSRLVDLLEIAAYVYAADCSTKRDGAWADEDSTEPWSREFHFVIPVRDIDFWGQSEVTQSLIDALEFLSNYHYHFEFSRLRKDRPKQLYLEELDDVETWPMYGVDRVLMFSGGLDSLAGVLETADNSQSLVLVSHRSVVQMDKRQRDLYKQINERYQVPKIHVPVWVNKGPNLDREHTQRTRSFLFSALGTAVAESIGAGGVRFFENGVVSLNLPLADEVLRARASRTTHPRALSLLSKFYRLVTEREFVLDNPYVFKTKADIVASIAERNAADLIGLTCSCAHTGLFQSSTQWHCGTCSQCIDRRIAILASGQEHNDPYFDYVSDVFTGPRQDGYEKNIAVNYVRNAMEMNGMSEQQIATKFNLELMRAVRAFPKQREAAECFIAMHRRHAATVCQVLEEQISQSSSAILSGKLEDTSMLALVCRKEHAESSWTQFAERIVDLLQSGLPASCQTHKPKDEPHLQQICDGILRGHDEKLVREFPFMSWSSVTTKPDWSEEDHRLWVELKYVRKKADIHPITEAIAADITKYGDNGRRVLYVVYDPTHAIVDEHDFAEPVLKRQSMLVRFIR